jgi:hypothetical protein
MKKLLEVRIPISPTPFFIRRVHLMAAALRDFGPAMAEHEIVVCVGEDVEPYNLYEREPWSTLYPLTWRWVSREAFQKDSYWETSHEVFRQHSRAKFVMCSDADTLFIRDLSQLLAELEREPAVAGVMGWLPPFRAHAEPPAEMWRRLFDLYGVEQAAQEHEHTGWSFLSEDPAERYGPPYYNFGMVLAPGRMMDAINAEMLPADRFAVANVRGNKRFQIALTLSMLRRRLPARILPMRYNFPNYDLFEQRYPEELQNVHVMHYLRRDVVDRNRDFESLAAMKALVERKDLAGANEILRRRIEQLYPVIEEEERM